MIIKNDAMHLLIPSNKTCILKEVDWEKRFLKLLFIACPSIFKKHGIMEYNRMLLLDLTYSPQLKLDKW